MKNTWNSIFFMLKRKIIRYRKSQKFHIHPCAKNAFDLYSSIDYQYLRIYKPGYLLSKLNHHQTLFITTSSNNEIFIFSGFANQFFDLQQINLSIILIKHENISDKDIELIAWTDVFRSIFSSKLEVSGRAKLHDLLYQFAPKEVIRQYFDNNLSVKEIAKLSSVSEGTLRKNLYSTRKDE